MATDQMPSAVAASQRSPCIHHSQHQGLARQNSRRGVAARRCGCCALAVATPCITFPTSFPALARDAPAIESAAVHQSGIRACPSPSNSPRLGPVNGLATGQMPYALAETKSSTCGHHSQPFCLARQQSEARACVRVGSVHLLPSPYTTMEAWTIPSYTGQVVDWRVETTASRSNAYWPVHAPPKEAQA